MVGDRRVLGGRWAASGASRLGEAGKFAWVPSDGAAMVIGGVRRATTSGCHGQCGLC